MSEELRGVVVCHGRLAGALVEAAEQISGVTGALVAGVQHRLRPRRARGAGRRGGRRRARPWCSWTSRAAPACSPCSTGSRASATAKVVTGVNLAMLVDFVFHRTLPLDEAAARAAIAGGQGDPGALMPIVLCRVDDRLVHGQVVIGWGRPLGVEFIVLVDDEVAASPWEQDLYRMAVPPELEIRFATVAEARAAARRVAGRRAARRWSSPATSRPWPPSTGPRPAVVRRINLGGIHHRPGRRERLPYLYLTDEELRVPGRAGGGGRGDHRAGPADLARRAAPDARVSDSRRTSSLLLVLWGTLVALDLVSVPQAMLSRPLVAGAVAGWIAGDVEAGLRVGVVLELFALDVLPIGAVRYPDYGPATVAATALAAGAPWELGLGRERRRGSASSRSLGGWSLQLVRRWNARAIQRRAAALAAGRERRDPAAAVRRPRCATRAAGRVLTALRAPGGAGRPCRWLPLDRQTAVGLTLVAIGVGAVGRGGRRGAERGPGRAAQVARGGRRRRHACWRCSDDRRLARAAPAVRGSGHLELRAHARRRHGVRRRAAARGSQDGRPGPARRGGRAVGGVLQLQSQPGRPGARRHGARRVRGGARARRSRGCGRRSAARSARSATSCSGPGSCRRSSGWRWPPWCSAPDGGRSLGLSACSTTWRGSATASGRSAPGSMPACASGSAIGASWMPRAVARIGPVAGAQRRARRSRWSAGWFLRGFGWTGALGALAVAAVGAAVTRWFGPALTSVRFALLAMGLLLFFRWMGL